MEKIVVKLSSTGRRRRRSGPSRRTRETLCFHWQFDDSPSESSDDLPSSESCDEEPCTVFSPPRRRSCKARRCSNSGPSRRGRKSTTSERSKPKPKPKPAPRPSGWVINVSDDEQEQPTNPQTQLVKERVSSFFNSKRLLSDDEEDVVVLPKVKKTDEPKPCVKYSIDSDDEVIAVDSSSRNVGSSNNVNTGSNSTSSTNVYSCMSSDLYLPSTSTAGLSRVHMDLPQASTSSGSYTSVKSEPGYSGASTAGPSRVSTYLPQASTSSASYTSVKSEPGSTGKDIDDDIMAFVDSILIDDGTSKKSNEMSDLKGLEDFRKETEEMLKNVSNLIDSFKGVKPKEPEPEKPKEPPVVPQNKDDTPTKKGLGSCPVCLEPLIQNVCSTTCGHIFCKACITQVARIQKKCPTCRKRLGPKNIHPLYVGV